MSLPRPKKSSNKSGGAASTKSGGASPMKSGAQASTKSGGASPMKSGAQASTKSGGASPMKSGRPNMDPQRIIAAEFLAGAAPGSSLPAPICVEIAFGGRSNVGKSSLINTLVERKNLVRTSSKPGSTRQINQYEARAADGTRFHLIDLPGYGYTRRSKAEQSAWSGLIEGYLQSRVTLAAVVVLVDIRRGLEPDDQELIDFVETAKQVTRRPVEVLVVATKLDKVARNARKTELAAIARATGRKVLGFSSETAEGRPELWRALRKAAFGVDPASLAASADAPADSLTTDDESSTTEEDASAKDADPIAAVAEPTEPADQNG